MLQVKLQHQLKQTLIYINIEDTKAKVYAIQGPSGIGETTILNIITGSRQPDETYINVDNQSLVDTENHINVKIQQHQIGYLFRDYQLFPNMTVPQNITFMTEQPKHIDEFIQRLDISHLMNQFPPTLSGGEARRVVLARTLSTKPNLILLDGPPSSSDDISRDEGIHLAKQTHEGWCMLIIFITHSNYEVEVLADKMIQIK